MLSTSEAQNFNRFTGELIRNAREAAGIKQDSLASFLGFKSRISIANIESGKQNIQLATLAEIADYLHVPIVSLIPAVASVRRAISRKFVRNMEKEGVTDQKSLEKIKGFIRLAAAKS